MKAISFSLALLIGFFSWHSMADTQSKSGAQGKVTKKSPLNTQIFEEDKSESGFTATVKIVREIQGDTQVFFEGIKGFYVLNTDSPQAGSWQNLLTASQKKKFPVTVSVNPESRQILSVTRSHEDP